jgi:diketogulonate reductase-like aldo/keto reductase
LLAELGTAHGVSSRAVALAFLSRRPSLFAIPKHSSVAHAEDNATGDLALSDAELATIDAAFPVPR